ncbi:restriction endonuclease subunit S [Marinobacter sp. HL-58]|uniref:restriction endonuclease subunit S n=1 Tax=Marinobacter sp. HL-58 TaxID=1479237 RepID=UPI00068A6A17|nr:restriction endonuclease subunit S [Marinobacter sp. HL-58]KPP97169.1 MAG: type I site-specific restriction-modification system specificity subunit HsdS [Marinobacter sp. HL-58]
MKASWQSVPIADLVEKIETCDPRKKPEEKFRYIDVSSVSRARLVVTESASLSGRDAPSRARRLVRAGDVIFATIRPTLNRIALIDGELDGSVCSTGFFVLRPKRDVLSRYLFYWLLGEKFTSAMEKLQRGASYPAVSDSDVRAQRVNLPPMGEQKRIVAILDEAFTGIDAAIANTEKNLSNAGELFESYLSSVFSSASLHWRKSALSDICSIKHGFAFKSEYFAEAGPFIVLTPGSFYESGGFRDQGRKTKFYIGDPPAEYILSKDDFLIAMTEQAAGLLGSSLVVPESRRFLHNQRLGLVVVRDGVDWHNDFFFHQFNTHGFRSAVQETASGVKVRHTSPGKLGAIQVFVPSYSEQVEIGEKLNMLLSEVRKLESLGKQKLESLTELKKSLLQKAFSGELTDDLAEKELDEAVA